MNISWRSLPFLFSHFASMSIVIFFFFNFLSLFSIQVSCRSAPPSLTEIKDLNNSELDEIFGSTVTKKPIDSEEPNIPEPGSQPTSVGRFSRPTGPREVPIDHGHALAPHPTDHRNNELSELGRQGADLFTNGANAFYRGAASVGQAFGIQPTNYQVPLFSQAASFFG